MVGYYCKISVGEVLNTIQYFSSFELVWYTFTGWISVSTECLVGGLV